MFGSQTHVKLVLVVKRFLDYSNQGLFELFVSLLSSACCCVFFFNDEIHFIFYNKYSAYYFIALRCLNELLSRLHRI